MLSTRHPVTLASLGPASTFYCEWECSYAASLQQAHGTGTGLLAPNMGTPQGPCKVQAVHKVVADGEFTIWKEAAAIMCGSMSHCSTKSFYLHISFLHVGKASIMKLCS